MAETNAEKVQKIGAEYKSYLRWEFIKENKNSAIKAIKKTRKKEKENTLSTKKAKK